MFPWQKDAAWSKILSASRIPPSAFSAITARASSSKLMPSFWATDFKWSMVLRTVIRSKSYIWQRLRMVGSILCFSVVAKMKITCAGGSSNVLRKALKAAVESIWTSSITYIFFFNDIGWYPAWSIITSRTLSTHVFEAASISI